MPTRRHAIAAGLVLASAPVLARAAGRAWDVQGFSRNFQWATVEDTIRIAREIGLSGLEWSVRPGGHIAPESADRELPRVVEATRRAGLRADMISANVTRNDPLTRSLLEAARSAGVKLVRGAAAYRWTGEEDRKAQYAAISSQIRSLAEAARRSGVAVALHTYSNPGSLGGNLYDLWPVISEIDPACLGFNYDMGHVVARSGAGWRDALLMARSHILAVSAKDFVWGAGPKALTADWRPIGQGVAEVAAHLQLLDRIGFKGPLVLQAEHDGLLGGDVGQPGPPVDRARFVDMMRADVTALKRAGA